MVGAVYDNAQPVGVIWDVSATSGECQLLVPRYPFCSTPCGVGAVCVADDTCQPNATIQQVGTVTVTGLNLVGGGAEFTIDPVNGAYQSVAALAYPPFTTGTPVRIAAAGSSFNGPFALDGVGVEPLELTLANPDLARDTALDLTWVAPAGSTASIEVKLDISHHGGTRGKIACKAADDGTLTLAGPLITGLLDLGASGFPTIIVDRRAITSTVIGAGRVDLEMQSEVQLPVTVPGIESCNEDMDCTPPETCQSDLTCG